MTPIRLLREQQKAHTAFHDFPKHWVDTDHVQLKNADVYPFLDAIIASAFSAGVKSEREQADAPAPP